MPWLALTLEVAAAQAETLSARDAAAAGQDLTQRAEALRRRAAELRDLPL